MEGGKRMIEFVTCTSCGTETTLEACQYMNHDKKCSTCGYCIDCDQYKEFQLDDELYKEERYKDFPNQACKILTMTGIYLEHEEATAVYNLSLYGRGITFQYTINDEGLVKKEITFFFLVHKVDDVIIDTALSVEKDNKLWDKINQVYTKEAIELFMEKIKMEFMQFLK